jgi:hypothetical protein
MKEITGALVKMKYDFHIERERERERESEDIGSSFPAFKRRYCLW